VLVVTKDYMLLLCLIINLTPLTAHVLAPVPVIRDGGADCRKREQEVD
jgi:hypothetical protein